MNAYTDFIVAAVVPRAGSPYGASHANGSIAPAAAMLAANPELAARDIHTAAILGDDVAVRRFIAADPASAIAKGGPYEWDALTHLCFSNYLKEDRSRTPGFVAAATALLDAGASANSGFFEPDDPPHPQWEPVLYGACGVAHHPELTKLLLDRGAKPDDNEVVYHSPETWDDAALIHLLDTRRLSADDLSMMLVRKVDFHHLDGVRLLLRYGADPAYISAHGWSPLHHAIKRDNSMAIIEELLNHGANPAQIVDGLSGFARAARYGRNDVLDVLARRGVPMQFAGVDELIFACAMGDGARATTIASQKPTLLAELRLLAGDLLARFSGTDNSGGVRVLLDLGLDRATPFAEGDGYFGIPEASLPIHVAAWRAAPDVVRLLIERGSPVDVPDANGRTPLALAVRACIDSYWTERRTPESVRMLLDAGAKVNRIPYPTGYDAVDALLVKHGARNE